MKKHIINAMNKFLPKNRLGDKIHAIICFIYFHRRLPNNSNNLVDVLYRVKVSNLLRDPVRVFVSDKENLKIFVRSELGEKFVVPTIALLEDDVSLNEFIAPETCVVKPCHSSGDVQFLNVGEKIDIEAASTWLKEDYYQCSRERNYKYLSKRVIVEPLVFGDRNINDYKFFFYDGKFLFVQVDVDRATNHTRSFYDEDFSFLGFSTKYPISSPQDRPYNFDEMLESAYALAKHFSSLIRIDLYTNGYQIKVGEITNCHGSGFEKTIPYEKEIIIDDFIKN